MPPRHTPSGDPLLKGADWSAVRAHWWARRDPCAVCGRAIRYERGYQGPDALDVGHIVSRDQAKAMGWTRRQINALTNTRPECRRCSRSSGATYGNTKRWQGGQWLRPVAADEW